ncbi:MAG: hypothetical protein JO069_09135 [Verrucomicrobia bacterium]|nr:hypothetical protein [Verrucomicrobiota bacterium]
METLPASKLVEVARFASALTPARREQRLAALKETAGCMAGPDGEAFVEQAVREEADRIDADAYP